MNITEAVDVENVKKFLKAHFTITGAIRVEPNGMVDVDGDVQLNEMRWPRLLVGFNIVSGNFRCLSTTSLASLHGAPKTVGDQFQVSGTSIDSLKYCSTTIGRSFIISNNKLSSLKGCPQKINGDFACQTNQISTLVGGPTEVDGAYICDKNSLTSLEGLPISINGEFRLNYSPLLPLLGLLNVNGVKKIHFSNLDPSHQVQLIFNKYLGKGRGGGLAAAAELVKAGLKGNVKA
jgi:hypothetical protein